MSITLRHKELARNLRKSKTMKEAMEKSEYSENYANASTQIKGTKGYQEAVKPVLEQYQTELQAILSAMALKNKKSEEYKDLVKAADTIQKQIQLLGGKPTEIYDDYSDLTNEELEQRLKQIRERENNERVSEKKA